MPLAVDEAIRAGDWNGNNLYYAIVDNTDNNQIYIATPKTTTDGVTLEFVNRHIPKDNAPWILGWDIPFAKKHGISYWSTATSKWPRIMSRINGVIDVENAKRWDGSAWQWLSQKGNYLFSGKEFANRTNQSISNKKAYANGYRVNISKDKNWVACTTSSSTVEIYKRNGDTLTLNATFQNVTYIRDVKFSEDAMYFAYIVGNYCNIAKLTNGTWTYLTSVAGTYVDIAGVCWNKERNLLILSTQDPYTKSSYSIFQRVGDNFNLLKTIINQSTNYYATTSTLNSINGYMYDLHSASTASGGGQYKIISKINIDSGKVEVTKNLGSVGGGSSSNIQLSSGTIIASYNGYSADQIILFDSSLNELKRINLLSPNLWVNSIAISYDEKYIFVSTNAELQVYSADFILLYSTQDFRQANGLACW